MLLGQLWVLSALGFSAVFFDVAAVRATLGTYHAGHTVATFLNDLFFDFPKGQHPRINDVLLSNGSVKLARSLYLCGLL